MRRLAMALLLCLAPAIIQAEKIPDSAWQQGTLRSVTSDTHSRLMGTYNNGQGMVGEQVRIVTHYTIEGAQYTYQADRTTRRHGKPLNVTINGPISFAVEGTDIYLKDDVGKVYKLTIETKTLMIPAQH